MGEKITKLHIFTDVLKWQIGLSVGYSGYGESTLSLTVDRYLLIPGSPGSGIFERIREIFRQMG